MAIVKPLKVNVDNIDLDTMELFESVSEELTNTGRVNAARFKELLAAMFEDWTIADAGKVTRIEMPQILGAIGDAFDQIPLESESE